MGLPSYLASYELFFFSLDVDSCSRQICPLCPNCAVGSVRVPRVSWALGLGVRPALEYSRFSLTLHKTDADVSNSWSDAQSCRNDRSDLSSQIRRMNIGASRQRAEQAQRAKWRSEIADSGYIY